MEIVYVKEREHREAKNAKAIFPRFSPSAVLAPPLSPPPLPGPGNLSEKAQNKAAKKEKENKWKQLRRRRRRGSEGKAVQRAPSHNSSLITAPSSRLPPPRLREEEPALLFWMRLPFSPTGSHFFSRTTGARLTAAGKDATWPKRTLAPFKIVGRRAMFSPRYTWAFGLLCGNSTTVLNQLNWHIGLPLPFLFILWFVSLRKLGSVSCGWSLQWHENEGEKVDSVLERVSSFFKQPAWVRICGSCLRRRKYRSQKSFILVVKPSAFAAVQIFNFEPHPGTSYVSCPGLNLDVLAVKPLMKLCQGRILKIQTHRVEVF